MSLLSVTPRPRLELVLVVGKDLFDAEDKPIPAKKLAKAAKAPGKLGQRARLAQTLKGLKK